MGRGGGGKLARIKSCSDWFLLREKESDDTTTDNSTASVEKNFLFIMIIMEVTAPEEGKNAMI